jgi:hypothetical protein
MGEEELSKDAAGAVVIKEILAKLVQKGTQSINLRALKQMSPFLAQMAKRTFQRARDMALGDDKLGWAMRGGSLARCT